MAKKRQGLSDDERFIMDALHLVGAETDNAMGVFMMLLNDEEQSAARTKKLVQYLKFKENSFTEQDILKKTVQITRDREQYYPSEKYVRYTGKTTKQLVAEEIYPVEMVFGCEETFLLCCEDGSMQEFPAELFELQEVTKAAYIGAEDEDGSIHVTKGFELNKTYAVERLNLLQYHCENGLICRTEEVAPVAFKKAEPTLPKPFENLDSALNTLKNAIEFGCIKDLSQHLHPDCIYHSARTDKKLTAKAALVEDLRKTANTRLADGIFCHCTFGTFTAVHETFPFPEGTRCMICFYEETFDLFLISLNKENNLITEIHVFHKEYYRDHHLKVLLDDPEKP